MKTIDFNKLNKEIQEHIKKEELIVEGGAYSGYEETAYLRTEIELNNKLYLAEIVLGSIDIRHSDSIYNDDLQAYVDEDGQEIDEDNYHLSQAKELLAITELSHCEVYLYKI